MKLSLKKRAAAIATAAVAVAAVSQGAGMSPASAATDIVLGISGSQVAATASSYAIKKGILAKNGLNATMQVVGPADVIPQLSAGRFQFAYMPILQALQARTNAGVDLRIVLASDGFSPNQAARAAKDRNYAKIIDPSGLCASKAITSLKGLEGKTVAVSSRGTYAEAVIGEIMRAAGADPKKVNFVVFPFNQTIPGIVAGKIDAGYTAAGFTPACEQNGLNLIGHPGIDTVQPTGGPVTAWVTTAKYAKDNPQVVAAFQKSMYQSAALINTNKDKMKEAVTFSTEYTKAPLASALATTMPYYFTYMNKAQVQLWANLLQRQGLVAKPVDVPGILWKQPATSAR